MKTCPDCCGSGEGTRHLERVGGRLHVDHDRCETCGGRGLVADPVVVNDNLLRICKQILPMLNGASRSYKLLRDAIQEAESESTASTASTASTTMPTYGRMELAPDRRRFIPSTDGEDLGAEQ